MIPFCLILGDSTAVGTAQALAAQGIRCEVHARVGAGSAEIERRVRGASAATVALIALGSNDAASPALPTNLLALRRRTTAVKVAWLAPYDLRASSIVTSIAARFGDTVIPLERRRITANIFTAPEIATVGWSQQAVDAGEIQAESVTLPLAGNARPSECSAVW